MRQTGTYKSNNVSKILYYYSLSNAGIPKNGSVPTFDRVRKHSTGERFKPSLAAIKASSRGDVGSNGDVRKTMHLKLSRGSFIGSKNNNAEDFVSSSHHIFLLLFIGICFFFLFLYIVNAFFDILIFR